MWGRINGLLLSHFFRSSGRLSSVGSCLPSQEHLLSVGSFLLAQERLLCVGSCLPTQEGVLGLCVLDCLLVE